MRRDSHDDRSLDPRTGDPKDFRHLGDPPERRRVAPLSDLGDFAVADDEPNPKGWKVRSSDGKDVGKVKDLIADTSAMKVRYLDVDLDKDTVRIDKDRHVLIPIGAAKLNDDDDRVVVNRPAADFAALPEYDSKRFNREYENEVRRHWGGGATSGTTISDSESDFYAHEHYDDSGFFGNRRRGRETETYFTRVERDRR